MTLDEHTKTDIAATFFSLVNIEADELEAWLATKESNSVGVVEGTVNTKKTMDDPRESVGHASGRRIAAILRTRRDQLDDDDYRHMKRVIGFIRRHSARPPTRQDIATSRWRYSLMNWGHDPLRHA